ncbi:MAG: hypothetical protein QM669_11270 [Siphonobacter sp.]
MKTFLFVALLISTGLYAQVKPSEMVPDTAKQTLKARVVSRTVTQTDSTGDTRVDRSTKLTYKNFNDTTSHQYFITPSQQKMIPDSLRNLKPDYNATMDAATKLNLERQNWADRITIQIKDLDDEIGMIQDNHSVGTKSPSESWKARLKELEGYRSQLITWQDKLSNAGSAKQVNAAAAKIKPLLAQARAALANGGR